MNRLDDENVALLTLLYACKRPDTWKSITNQCLIEGSARRVLLNRLDPQRNPLREFDEAGPVDFALFPEPLGADRRHEYDAAACCSRAWTRRRSCSPRACSSLTIAGSASSGRAMPVRKVWSSRRKSRRCSRIED